jgi:GT2 family glycosyltransferase
MSAFPELAIVIVNYNLKDDCIECIDALSRAGALLTQIIVVDNASTDGSVDALRMRYGDQLKIIEAKENRGYPHGLNLGIPVAMEDEAQWILLMNNDTVVAEDFIYELARATQADPSVALIGPLILYFEAPDTIWYLGYKIIPGTLIGHGSYRGRKLSSSLPQLMPMDLMHGCAMMVRRDVFEKIGLFDDSQIIYGDDADFSWRAKKAGFKAAAATKARIWHKISLTMGRLNPRTRYLRTRNTIRFYYLNAHGVKRVIMLSFTFVKNFYLTLTYLFRGHIDLLGPLWFGYWDGWKGSYSTVRNYK